MDHPKTVYTIAPPPAPARLLRVTSHCRTSTYLKSQGASLALHQRKAGLYRKRGRYASRELAIRNLLGLIDGTVVTDPRADPTNGPPASGTRADPADFFRRTRPPTSVDALDASGRSHPSRCTPPVPRVI